MSGLWWGLGLSCFGLVVIAGILFAILWWRLERFMSRLDEEGDLTFAWLVQANNSLYEKGWMDLPAAQREAGRPAEPDLRP